MKAWDEEWRTTEETYTGPPREPAPPRPMNFWEFLDRNGEGVFVAFIALIIFAAFCISTIWGK